MDVIRTVTVIKILRLHICPILFPFLLIKVYQNLIRLLKLCFISNGLHHIRITHWATPFSSLYVNLPSVNNKKTASTQLTVYIA